MKRKLTVIMTMLMVALTVLGCNAAYDESMESYTLANQNNNLLDDETSPERKIVYTVNISFDVQSLENASDYLYDSLESDEWFDRETINSTSYSYVIRIKTSRLDDFISILRDEFTVRSYEKTGTDISLQYQDVSDRILSLQTQLDRLLVLYENATLSEMIMINEQISDIEVELQQLNGELNQFDSLVDYSTVNLVFYGSKVITSSPFFNRLGNAFLNGFSSIVAFFDNIVIGLATAFPYLVLFGAIGFGGIKLLKSKKTDKSVINEEKKKSSAD